MSFSFICSELSSLANVGVEGQSVCSPSWWHFGNTYLTAAKKQREERVRKSIMD